MKDNADVRVIWGNGKIPVIAVPPSGELRVRLPFSIANKEWLRIGNRKPDWNRSQKCWELPRSWLNRLARHAVRTFGQCYIVQSIREIEKCCASCWNASSVDCECSCLGENHGCDNAGAWFEVSETFACRVGERGYSIRLIHERATKAPSMEDLTAASGVQWRTYFVIGGGLIKIGKSTDVEGRLRTLQTGSPAKLALLGSIDGDHESEWHQRFAACRVGGEWFRLDLNDTEMVIDAIEAESN